MWVRCSLDPAVNWKQCNNEYYSQFICKHRGFRGSKGVSAAYEPWLLCRHVWTATLFSHLGAGSYYIKAVSTINAERKIFTEVACTLGTKRHFPSCPEQSLRKSKLQQCCAVNTEHSGSYNSLNADRPVAWSRICPTELGREVGWRIYSTVAFTATFCDVQPELNLPPALSCQPARELLSFEKIRLW